MRQNTVMDNSGILIEGELLENVTNYLKKEMAVFWSVSLIWRMIYITFAFFMNNRKILIF